MYVQTNGNFVFEEILNSLSHGLAFLASVVGANLLISQVSKGASEECVLMTCTVDIIYYNVVHLTTHYLKYAETEIHMHTHTLTHTHPLSLSHAHTHTHTHAIIAHSGFK